MLKLTLRDIGKSYAGHAIIKGCSSEFAQGINIIMGPNGCGKSTLLRLCAFLEPTDSGAVEYSDAGGTRLEHGLALMRRITLVLPKNGIFDRSVYQNAAYGMLIRGMAEADIRSRANGLLDMVGLLSKSSQNARSLSSGEAQRLALARALAIEPDVLFLDEPTASVDEENTSIIEDIICSLRCPGGPTVIMTTHDRAQAERVADRMVEMRAGTIQG